MRPKTLIISTWSPPMVGGPTNLYNIFSQYDSASYCILTGYSAITNVAHNSTHWLKGRYYFYDAPGINNYRCTQCLNESHGNNTDGRANKSKNNVVMKIIHSSLRYKGILNLIAFIPQLVVITYYGVKIVRKEKIKIIIGISGDGLAQISAFLTHKITRIPYTLYLFDLYRGNNYPASIRLLARIVEPTLFKNASKIFLTNEGTVALYKKRYGEHLPYEIIYNSVFPEKYKRGPTTYSPQSPFSIIFTGHIYWPQEQSVLNLIEAVKNISEIDVTLTLYAPKAPQTIIDAAAQMENVKIASALPDEMPAIQGSADLLFLPLSWDTPSPEIIETATPGKFTDYLIAGRPMLIHAPEYAYISQYVKERNLGLVVDKNDTTLLAQSIISFFKNPQQGQKFVDNARKTFYDKHDAHKMAHRLTEALKHI